ncbi:uncharacterized protein LAESUDRAFT_732837 [Laetiporus sulphureus 93-53]|uniref:Uncharacterized protein n=1 Tax=Laetiporus sulphureus 93-53 TaxID=1314785 RepID=A0A165AXF3_9APHY|nr:uncharacterized protein LAESUDRAFT_732837 [Laetiporus sulphureus 93-53]KZS99839.1 hypothetical protein LAESUDRAFT_732837 [Laetiporus sulphureus 93-53]
MPSTSKLNGKQPKSDKKYEEKQEEKEGSDDSEDLVVKVTSTRGTTASPILRLFIAHALTQHSLPTDHWILDSSTTAFMSSHHDWFIQFTNLTLPRHNIYYVLQLQGNLLSTSRLTEQGQTLTFCGDTCKITCNGETTGLAHKTYGLYVLASIQHAPMRAFVVRADSFTDPNEYSLEALAAKTMMHRMNIVKWHHKACHMGTKLTLQMVYQGTVSNTNTVSNATHDVKTSKPIQTGIKPSATHICMHGCMAHNARLDVNGRTHDTQNAASDEGVHIWQICTVIDPGLQHEVQGKLPSSSASTPHSPHERRAARIVIVAAEHDPTPPPLDASSSTSTGDDDNDSSNDKDDEGNTVPSPSYHITLPCQTASNCSPPSPPQCENEKEHLPAISKAAASLSHTRTQCAATPAPTPKAPKSHLISALISAHPVPIRDDNLWSSVSAYKPKTFSGGLGAKTKWAVETPEGRTCIKWAQSNAIRLTWALRVTQLMKNLGESTSDADQWILATMEELTPIVKATLNDEYDRPRTAIGHDPGKVTRCRQHTAARVLSAQTDSRNPTPQALTIQSVQVTTCAEDPRSRTVQAA